MTYRLLRRRPTACMQDTIIYHRAALFYNGEDYLALHQEDDTRITVRLGFEPVDYPWIGLRDGRHLGFLELPGDIFIQQAVWDQYLAAIDVYVMEMLLQ